MGGEINKVDLVRDQFALQVAGGHAVKILFDERTQVFQNGQKLSVLNLHNADHASIETRLDGTDIFALKIHILSQLPEGRLRGQVIGFNASTGELKFHAMDASDTITLKIPNGTPIMRVGQSGFAKQVSSFADLMHGSLVDITFISGKNAPGSATRIDVLAVPGSEFIFRGSLASLDLRAGRMAIASTVDNPPMDISFEPKRFSSSADLHQGSSVKVTTRFDGTHYVATDIVVE